MLSTSIKVPFDIKICVLSIFEWLLKTSFTICLYMTGCGRDREAKGPSEARTATPQCDRDMSDGGESGVATCTETCHGHQTAM